MRRAAPPAARPVVTPRATCRQPLTPVDTLHGWVAEHARRRPDAVALRCAEGVESVVSYRTLDAAAAGLAARLRAYGVRPGDVVPVRLPRGPSLVAALVGVLRCGAAYVALPVDWPVDRTAALAGRYAAPLVIDLDPASWPPSASGRPVRPASGRPVPLALGVPAGLAGWTRWGSYRAAGMTGADPAGVFGAPAGADEPRTAPCMHRTALATLRDGGSVRLGPDTVTLQAASPAEAGFGFEVWGALVRGGCCVVAPSGPLAPAMLRTAIGWDGVTTLLLTTVVFATLLDADLDCFAGVREVVTSGGPLPAAHVRRFAARYPGTPLVTGSAAATLFGAGRPAPVGATAAA
ncbi:MAG TPA: AMP-binding protein [Mycobacteriales bacterium]|nr:AMP-binding protein [Mycobacteriales bacterium]